MSAITIDQALEIALQHHREGRLDPAEAIYRQVLSQFPEHGAALNCLGILSAQRGHYDLAIELLTKVTALYPENPEILLNLSEFHRTRGDFDQSIAAARQAILLKPDYAEAHNNLGVGLTARGFLEEAIASLQMALALMADRARAAPHQAADILAHSASMHNNLGNVLRLQGRPGEALQSYEKALELNPNHAEAHASRGGTLREAGRVDESISSLRRALELNPALAEAHNNLAIALGAVGGHAESIACFDAAIALRPGNPSFASNRLYSLSYLPDADPVTLLQQARAWDQHHAQPLCRHIQPHANERSPGRRLRVGYVSPDFRTHPVSAFFLPLLAHHSAAEVEVFCYSGAPNPDGVTARIQALAHSWRATSTFSDEALAQQIRADRIDVLVDLALHTQGNRLLVFARKPAPVQLTWLGYAGTTGLEAIAYRVTDAYLDPPGENDAMYAEKSIRLPHCFWCYQPLIETPPVNSLPALSAGFITFSCLNNFAKASAPAIAAWIRILVAVPRSRLLLNCPRGAQRDDFGRQCAAPGVDPGRLEFVEHAPMDVYYARYHSIDIALDPFPYCGGTSTCDALWMGVPVVTLAGRTAVSRAGVSILSNAGVDDLQALITQSPDAYVSAAVHLANDLPGLARMRLGLRPALQSSPLMNARQFATDMEHLFRQAWKNWCGNRS